MAGSRLFNRLPSTRGAAYGKPEKRDADGRLHTHIIKNSGANVKYSQAFCGKQKEFKRNRCLLEQYAAKTAPDRSGAVIVLLRGCIPKYRRLCTARSSKIRLTFEDGML